MILDFSSIVPNTSGAECCLVYSGRVCRLLDLNDVVYVAWVRSLRVLKISTHRYLMRLTSMETDPLAFNSVK